AAVLRCELTRTCTTSPARYAFQSAAVPRDGRRRYEEGGAGGVTQPPNGYGHDASGGRPVPPAHGQGGYPGYGQQPGNRQPYPGGPGGGYPGYTPPPVPGGQPGYAPQGYGQQPGYGQRPGHAPAPGHGRQPGYAAPQAYSQPGAYSAPQRPVYPPGQGPQRAYRPPMPPPAPYGPPGRGPQQPTRRGGGSRWMAAL